MSTSTFSGFPATTLKFLRKLAKNNDRDWFGEHRSRYETEVLAPALAFIEVMAGPIARISQQFEVKASRSGGSLMRIYRDTRFSSDKTPYKTNIGIQFRHVAGKDVHAPGFYVHVEPGGSFLGAGMWRPDSKPLAAIRARIAEDPKAWKRVVSQTAFRDHFELRGASLKRAPRGFDPDHPMVEDLKRKDFIAVCDFDAKAIESRGFAKTVSARFKTARGFMRYLCDAVGVDF